VTTPRSNGDTTDGAVSPLVPSAVPPLAPVGERVAGPSPKPVAADVVGGDSGDRWKWWTDPLFIALGFCAVGVVCLVTAACLQ